MMPANDNNKNAPLAIQMSIDNSVQRLNRLLDYRDEKLNELQRESMAASAIIEKAHKKLKSLFGKDV